MEIKHKNDIKFDEEKIKMGGKQKIITKKKGIRNEIIRIVNQ